MILAKHAAAPLIALLFMVGCERTAPSPGLAPAQATGSFPSGGRTITVELFQPEGDASHAAVILLHGAYGPERDGEFLRPLGQQLAARGYLVLLPHYFDRTATNAADLVGKDGVLPEGAKLMERHYATWEATAEDAIRYAAAQPGVHSERIGLVGFSLGAALACSLATHAPSVKAVVDFGGGLPFAEPGKIGSTPPTLICHGDADKLVPVEFSVRFERLLKSGGVACELVRYPGEDHYLGAEALRDADHRALEFLVKHLDTM